MFPSILENEGFSKAFLKNWARLILKIDEVDPLTCPKCSPEMWGISMIEDENIINKILKHLGLWDRKARPPPKGKRVNETIIDYSESQLPPSDNYLYYNEVYPEAMSSWFKKRKWLQRGRGMPKFHYFSAYTQHNLNTACIINVSDPSFFKSFSSVIPP